MKVRKPGEAVYMARNRLVKQEWKKKELIIACLKRLSIKSYHALMPLEDRMEDVKSAILPLYAKYSTSKHII